MTIDHRGGDSVSGYGNVVPEYRQLCHGTCRGGDIYETMTEYSLVIVSLEF